MTLVRLGFQMLRSGGRSAALRFSLLIVGAALSCFVVLTVVGMSQLAERQDIRDASTAPLNADREGGALEGVVQEGVTPIKFSEMIDGWGSTDLKRTVVAGVGPNSPTPPGVDRLPGPDEVVLSPALQQLAQTEPTVAQRFPQELIGSISDDGLTEPDALVAYVGVETEQLPDGFETSGFGTTQVGFSSRDPGASRTVALLLLAFLLVPIVVFLSTCARLSAHARDQRLASLRLIGLTARRTQVVNSIEVGVGAFAGSAVGLIVFTIATHTARSAQVGRLSFFVTDVRVAPLSAIIATAAIGVLALIVAAASSQSGINRPLEARREQSVRTVKTRRIIPLITGIVLLAISWATAPNASIEVATWLIPFGTGLALTAIGITLAAPFVSIAIGRLLVKLDRPSALIAAGRLRHDPTAGSRLIAGLSVSVFAIGFAFVVLAVIDQTRYSNEDVFTETAALVVRVPGGATLDEITSLDGIIIAAPVRENVSLDAFDASRPRTDADVVVADCATARVISGLDLTECRDDVSYRLESITDAEYSDGFRPIPPSDIPEPIGTLGFDFLRPSGDAAAFLTPPDGDITSTQFIAIVDTHTYTDDPDQLVATLAERFPSGYWVVGINDGATAAVSAGFEGFVLVGSTAALLIGLLALAIATVDKTIDRRRELSRLTAIGTPLATLRRAHLWQTLPVTTTVMIAAGAASLIGGSSYLNYGGDGVTAVPLNSVFALTAIAVIGVTVASLAGLAAMTPRQDVAHLRDE